MCYRAGMARNSRNSEGGVCYHALNRGNNRATVFQTDEDYAALIELIAMANQRISMRVLAYALMPNHFHFVLWPHGDGDLSRWMQWLETAFARRCHRLYGGSGHIFQGRFKAFPIEQDDHLWMVLRYVERNPVRAQLVSRAELWRWTSLAWRTGGERPELLADWPIACPSDWLTLVNRAETDAELAALRASVRARFGVRRLDLERTL